MDTSPLNLDLLSRELAETQQYLENAPQIIRRSLRASKELSSDLTQPIGTGNSSTKSQVSTNNASSYSSPESRDERINQLLEDYQKRKEAATSRQKESEELYHQIQLFQSPSKAEFKPEDIPATENESYFNTDHSDSEVVYNDSLYFASDIQREYHNTLPPPTRDDLFDEAILVSAKRKDDIDQQKKVSDTSDTSTSTVNRKPSDIKDPTQSAGRKRSQSAGRLFSSLQRLSKPRNQGFKDDSAVEIRSSKALPASYLNSRINSMHSKHQQQLKNREKLKYEYERLALMECTFAPQISSSAKKMKDQSVSNKNNSSSSASVSNRLHEEAAVRRKQLHWLGQQLQEESLAECTFQPTIITKKSTDYGHVPIHQRVVDLQRQKQRNLHQLRDNIEKEQTDLIFKPKLTPKSSSLAKERYSRYSVDDNMFPSFRSIASTKDAIRELTESDANTSVVDRLLSEGKRLQRRKQEMFMEREEELFNECQKSALSKGTQILARKSPLVKVDFDTRQKYHEDRLFRNHQKQIEAQQLQQNRWFKPQIQSKTERILSHARPELLDEDQTDRSNRLWKIDSEEKAVKIKELEEEFYGQISFSPQINPISKLFGRKSSIEELYENQTGKHSMNVLKLKIEAECNEECTFQPKINEYSKEIASEKEDNYDLLYSRYYENSKTKGYAESPIDVHTDKKSRGIYSLGRINFQQPEKMVSEIHLHRLEKENRRQQELILREVEELQDCTFHPDLRQNQSFAVATSPKRDGESPVVIKGLARHMELKELSQKLKKEQLDREYAAFHVIRVDEYRRPEDGSTIVQPFCLASDEKKVLHHKTKNTRMF